MADRGPVWAGSVLRGLPPCGWLERGKLFGSWEFHTNGLATLDVRVGECASWKLSPQGSLFLLFKKVFFFRKAVHCL